MGGPTKNNLNLLVFNQKVRHARKSSCGRSHGQTDLIHQGRADIAIHLERGIGTCSDVALGGLLDPWGGIELPSKKGVKASA